jgi:hypothetical protein
MFTAPLHSNGRYSGVACVFVAAGVCLPSTCLAVDVSSDFTIPAFGRHVTICLCVLCQVRGRGQSSLQLVPEPFSPGVKRPGREVDHVPRSNAEINNEGAILPLPHTSSWHGA